MTIDQALLRKAVDYANELLGRDVALEWGEEAIVADFKHGMAKTWIWGATARAYYDARNGGDK